MAQQPWGTQLDMLRQVTNSMASTEDLGTVLGSIVDGLVDRTRMLAARIWLLQRPAECDLCRGNAAELADEPALHMHASAGAPEITALDTAHHMVSLDVPVAPAVAVRERRPNRNEHMARVRGLSSDSPLVEILDRLGASGSAAFPLIFRGEVLGAIGMIANRQLEDAEFQLLGVFADQAAMAVKSAQLFREVARSRDRLEVENAYLQAEVEAEGGFAGIVGESPALKAVLRKVRQVAPVETTVLLTGETGTGKELIARAVHEGSPRKSRPLIKINCGAIPHGVVESELFGHEKGAFTGALQQRIGRFELANNGTLFMDEVGELPLETQVKLLRVLQEGEFERVGSAKLQRVDVRLIAATNRNLEAEVEAQRFRADLYYRLNVFPIRIPPLRDRPSDIPLLARHFVKHFQRKLAKPLEGFTPESMRRLERYPWPGNIRELQNVVERACVLAEGPVVEIDELTHGPAAASAVGDGRIVPLEENERQHIRRALAATNGRIHGPDGAAKLLGLNPSTLRSRIAKLGIDRDSARREKS